MCLRERVKNTRHCFLYGDVQVTFAEGVSGVTAIPSAFMMEELVLFLVLLIRERERENDRIAAIT